jgi:hypothetical protein
MADIFTDVGETLVADYVDGTASAPANWYVAWGTGAGTAAKTDTTLFTEASESRVTATESQPAANQNQRTGVRPLRTLVYSTQQLQAICS